MSFLEIIGAAVVGLLGLGFSLIALVMIGNIYGGIKGAYRLRMIRARYGKDVIRTRLLTHSQTIKIGLQAWSGKRYNGETGHYWHLGGMKVPVDGRDPIRRDRFWGAGK